MPKMMSINLFKSLNDNRNLKRVIDPRTLTLVQSPFGFTMFKCVRISSSLCINILASCLPVLLNQVIILVQTITVTLRAFLR